ncbi:hypothetical protein chiPu_0008983 [Chiloscyllium punctatum]|uniref:Uncharacterized protein n=1 Tax=Chiloscyllium punctatum TaxID=137246 RepID=A0A401SJF4_CHIPU|nr:hypothetical protein [Chiloscyllium punctatum]
MLQLSTREPRLFGNNRMMRHLHTTTATFFFKKRKRIHLVIRTLYYDHSACPGPLDLTTGLGRVHLSS